MHKKFKKITKISKYIFYCLFIVLFAFNSVLAVDIGDLTKSQFGLKPLATAIGLETNNAPTLSQMLGQIVGLALSLLGVMFMILIVYGGFKWMMARGNDDEAKKAKEIIINATIGVVIVFSAYVVSNFIISSLYGVVSTV